VARYYGVCRANFLWLGARIEGWFKRPKKGGQIRKNKKNLRYVIIEGCEEEAGWVEEIKTLKP